MSLEKLPADLPVPHDDGAADHLIGMHLPPIALPSTLGESVVLSDAGSPWAVVYVYPMTGRPDHELPAKWDLIPGARGCTPQTCSFRDHKAALSELGADVYGLSVQATDYQREMVDRLHVNFPVLSDAAGEFGAALNLPTMQAGEMTLYKRLTMIIRGGRIEHVMYPVFPPDENAADVVSWLRDRLAAKEDAASAWNERYTAAHELYGPEPNQFVAAELSGLSPRRVLDLGCGQGRNAVWLALQGHDVTGLDVSSVGIDQARALAARTGADANFEVIDVAADYQPQAAYDLVVLSYLQLPPEMRSVVHGKAVASLAPGGELLLIAHHVDNLEQGIGGPPTADVLFSEAELAVDFAELELLRNEKVYRNVERDGVIHQAHDILLKARRP
ncbi:MAG: redoxin family protein [Acidimicrobiia bacterium]|nr:redoxin family protein [Acidimicrobiia bacterium]